MSYLQTVYAFTILISLVLGIIFAVIDGMLLYAVVFFSIFLMLVILTITWGIAGWVENVTRKLGEDQ